MSDAPDLLETPVRQPANACVHRLRDAWLRGDEATAHDQFTQLWRISASNNEHWIQRVLMLTPSSSRIEPNELRKDLMQELACFVWGRLTGQIEESSDSYWFWGETYFHSLMFAQRKVAQKYMREAGYWLNRRAKEQPRGIAEALPEDTDIAAPAPELDLDEVLGMRVMVEHLPVKERLTVILRYWHGMTEQEVATRLGCTDRTVRHRLNRAHAWLRAGYEQGEAI